MVVAIERLLLYLETTVFNYYFDADREGHEDVVRLFEAIRSGRFEVYASKYVTAELERAPEPKRSKMLGLIEEYGVTILGSTPDAARLANAYIANGIIPASHRYDSAHIAIASVYGLDCVVSYNFEHINRDKTRFLTASVNQEKGYGSVIICTAGEVFSYDRRTF